MTSSKTGYNISKYSFILFCFSMLKCSWKPHKGNAQYDKLCKVFFFSNYNSMRSLHEDNSLAHTLICKLVEVVGVGIVTSPQPYGARFDLGTRFCRHLQICCFAVLFWGQSSVDLLFLGECRLWFCLLNRFVTTVVQSCMMNGVGALTNLSI